MAQTSRSNPAIGGAVPTQYDLMMALARKIVSGEEDDAETVEDVLAQARNAEATAEELLVDDGWKPVEVEPAAPANGNGHHANGNVHHDETLEPQQTLFSWAEFMGEEPTKPKGRGRKPQPATLSMFEWAMSMEREKKEEPVGLSA